MAAMRRLVRGVKSVAPTALHRRGALKRDGTEEKGAAEGEWDGGVTAEDWSAEVKERARLMADLETAIKDLSLASQLSKVRSRGPTLLCGSQLGAYGS